MDYSLPTLFVVPSGNTIPTSGSTQALTANQFGIFRSDYTAATAGNIATEPYIYLAQGRSDGLLELSSKKTDKISKLQIVDWYKVVAEADLFPQITDVSSWKIQCGEDISITFRLHSNYIDSAFHNGLTRSITVKAPCCACGADPCTDLDPQALVDQVILKVRQDVYLNKYLNVYRIGTGTSSTLRVTGNTLDQYSLTCDPAAYPFEFDRLWFRVFIYPGAETTQDFLTVDNCDIAGTSTVVQRASYLRGQSGEIAQLEKNWYSYQTDYKEIFRKPGYNGGFTSLVVAGTFYDTYYLKVKPVDEQYTWAHKVPQDFEVVVAFPTTTGSTFETIMTAYLGAPTNKSANDKTTTTTTSTTTTSTTTTTILFP